MQKEIGSNFWFSEEDVLENEGFSSSTQITFCGDDNVFLSTGRSAIRLALQCICEESTVDGYGALVPCFTCESVLQPFFDFGFKLHPLEVDRNLNYVTDDLVDYIRDNNIKVLLFHHYFGFESVEGINGIIDRLHRCGVQVIEDRTQCLYSNFPVSNADYIIGSLRKWTGLPDGAFIFRRQGTIENKPTRADCELVERKVKASIMKNCYMIGKSDDKIDYLREFQEAEKILNSRTEIFKMSDISCLLQSKLDVMQLKRARRKNYEYIVSSLGSMNVLLYKDLPKEVVPLYCPIFVKNRDVIQRKLCENDIYAPIVWPKNGLTDFNNDNANQFYEHLLCLPIDQRYGIDDMERMVSVASGFR